MPGESPFADDWRDCLRAHYTYVVRAQDTRTLETLTGVLHQVGFSTDELSQVYIQATMRAEEMPEDFVPDPNFVIAVTEAISEVTAEAPPEPLIAVAEAASLEIENLPEEAPVEDVLVVDEPPPPEEPPHDPDGPAQMSLF